VLARLQRLGIGGIVIARIGGEPAFPHSAVLRAAVTGTDSPYRLAARLAHRNRPGVTEIYLLPRPIAPNAGEIRALGNAEQGPRSFRQLIWRAKHKE
jgi:hypothetical protein